MKHLGVGRTRTNLPVVRANAKPLRALIGTDIPSETDAARFAPIPTAARRNAIEAAVEVQILDQEAFDALIAVPLGDFFFENVRATLVQHLVSLDVDAPRATARVHRALRLDRQHFVADTELPFPIDDAHARVIDSRHEVTRAVVRGADIDDDFVARLQQ